MEEMDLANFGVLLSRLDCPLVVEWDLTPS